MTYWFITTFPSQSTFLERPHHMTQTHSKREAAPPSIQPLSLWVTASSHTQKSISTHTVDLWWSDGTLGNDKQRLDCKACIPKWAVRANCSLWPYWGQKRSWNSLKSMVEELTCYFGRLPPPVIPTINYHPKSKVLLSSYLNNHEKSQFPLSLGLLLSIDYIHTASLRYNSLTINLLIYWLLVCSELRNHHHNFKTTLSPPKSSPRPLSHHSSGLSYCLTPPSQP